MSASDSIKVVCRVRPLNSKEQSNGSSFIVGFPSSTSVSLANRQFNYDCVLQPSCSQLQVYSIAARPLVQDVLSGYNATIFAYGQTSSGKTHTMEGVLGEPEMQGIIPRIVQDMFDHIYSMDANLEIHIKVSYFEIYMERIRDLLDVSKVNLPIGETKSRVPYVKGVTERFVTSPEEVLAVLEEGKSGRHVSVTNMNAHSSRSHAVFLICIKQENKETRQTLTGKLYLVDLAGSEKVEKTNAQGLTLDEAKTINRSLLALSNVIAALAEGNKPYIPYRDSKLTRVLQESLGGNARTTLVICCSPSSFNEAETKTTLMFGDRAKTIKNKVEMNVELTAEEWRRRFEKQRNANAKLKALLESYESELSRWRSGETVPEKEQASARQLPVATLSVDDISNRRTDSPSSLGGGGAGPIGLGGTPSSGTPSLSPVPFATPTPAEARAFEEERTKLYQQIDEKDEELQSQTEIVERLTSQLHELEDNLQSSQKEGILLKKQITVIEQELLNSQEEVHEVMQALEELAVSYDSKDREIEAAHSEKKLFFEEIEKLQQSVDSKSHELDELKDSSQIERRKTNDMLSTLFREVSEATSTLGTPPMPGSKSEERLRAVDSSTEVSEEDFTRARIHLSNLRCEARTLKEQRDLLEGAEREARERATTVMKELATCRLKISQYETQNESLMSNLREAELKKEELQHTLVSFNEQLVTLKTREQGLLDSEMDREQEQSGVIHSANEMKRALEERLQQHLDSHQRQVETLKAEISTKEAHISQVSGRYQEQLLAVNLLREELEQTQQHYNIERQKYAKIRAQMKVKEKIRRDLGGLTDTVSHELDRLNQLRQAYLTRMTNKVKSKAADGAAGLNVSPDRRELHFLEKNLEELSRAHKKTMSENSDMQREIPRLHAVLASKSKRIGELEHMLRETKEAANQEYDRLRAENERLTESFTAKLKEKEREYQYGRVVKRQGPNIARPVPRKASEASHARDALLAGAGVTVIGQRRKPRQLESEQDSANSRGGAWSRNETGLSS